MCSQDSGEQSKQCWSRDNRARGPRLWRKNQAGGSERWNFKNSHPEGVALLSQGPAQAMATPPVEQLGLERGLTPTLGSVQVPHSSPCLCPAGLHPASPGRRALPWQHPQRDPGGARPTLCTFRAGEVSGRCRDSKASSICELASLENPKMERNPVQPGGVRDQLSVPSFTRKPFPEHLLCVGPGPAVLARLLHSSLWLKPWQ